MPRQPRIHVVGSSPRSGTTLTFELLVSCFEIDRFGDHEISVFKRPAAPERPFASKQPMDFVHVRRLMRWDPLLHVVYMQRDPRDVIVSQHGRYSGRYWCDFDVWQRNQDLFSGFSDHQLFECRYEDLVVDPDRVQDALVAKFPFLLKRHNFSDFDKVSQSSQAAQLALKGVRKISASSIGKWRGDLPRIASQLHAFPALSSYLLATGYEKDNAWADVCTGVMPNNMESVRAEHDKLRGKGRISKLTLRIFRRISTFFDQVRYIAGYSK